MAPAAIAFISRTWLVYHPGLSSGEACSVSATRDSEHVQSTRKDSLSARPRGRAERSRLRRLARHGSANVGSPFKLALPDRSETWGTACLCSAPARAWSWGSQHPGQFARRGADRWAPRRAGRPRAGIWARFGKSFSPLLLAASSGQRRESSGLKHSAGARPETSLDWHG